MATEQSKAQTHIRELLREALATGPHTNIKEVIDTLPITEKINYLNGFEEGLDMFSRILLAELELGNLEITVKN